MPKTSFLRCSWGFYSSLLILILLSQPQAGANATSCASWSDADFAEDANQSSALVNYVVSPQKFALDIDYHEKSLDKPEVDRVFGLDKADNARCLRLTVQGGKISPEAATQNFVSALAAFRGCNPQDLKKLAEVQRKEFAKRASAVKIPPRSKNLIATPDEVQRLNWAAEFTEKSGNTIMPFVSGASSADENFGSVLFKLKTRDGKTVVKRFPVSSKASTEFCEAVPALERRLHALYSQEQNRMLAKLSGDGTAECLAWLSSNREFNGKPAGSGLLSYLKIEPVSPSQINYDKAYTTLEESAVAGTTNKKVVLRPLHSEDHVTIVRDEKNRLVTAELFTPGVRKSKYWEDKFFNKFVEFDYSSGRCQPKTIEYGETKGKFKVSNESCRQIEKAMAKVMPLPFDADFDQGAKEKDFAKYIDDWKRIESDLKQFIQANQFGRVKEVGMAHHEAMEGEHSREIAAVRAKMLEDSRTAIQGFCSQFDPYLD